MRKPLASHVLRSYRHIQNRLTALRLADQPRAELSPGSPIPRGDIVVLPGSFNPPTIAHLALLRQARKFSGGHVYAALSTHIVDKEAVERMTLLDRAALLQHVFRHEVKGAGILLLNRGLYVEQAQALHASFPRVRRLSFLMGFDKIVQILDPHYYVDRDAALRELFQLASLLVAPRGKDGKAELLALLARSENRPFASSIYLLPLAGEYRDISSTQARQGNGDALDVLPREVRDFLWRTNAYSPPTHQTDGSVRDLYVERVRKLQQLLSDEDGERPAYWSQSAPGRPRSGDSE